MARRNWTMNQHARLAIEIELVRHAEQNVLRLQFDREALRDWCLGLCLLKEGLVEAFIVSELRAQGKKVNFVLEPQLGGNARITLNPQSSKVVMTKNNLDCLHRYFLKYYRDGVAEVDHLDLQAVDAETGDNEVYITFQVPESREPITPEKAKARLEEWS
jgi:hypothetical protein